MPAAGQGHRPVTTAAHGRSIRQASVGAALAIVAGCNGLTDEQHGVVDRWLLCDECTSGERDSVRALGEKAVARLTGALLKGPPADRRQLMTQKFENIYASLTPAPPITQAAYVNELLGNYVATYQSRSAVALGEIGGDGARDALNTALSPPQIAQYRADVVDVIRFVRSTLGATPFGGTVSPSAVGVGDTVRISAAPNQPFTGDEVAALDDAPLAPNDVLMSVQPRQLQFLAAGTSGNHAVAISNVGTTTDTQIATVAITTLLDANDRAMLSCETLACIAAAAPFVTQPTMPFRSVLSLWRTVSSPDTLDALKVLNSSPASPLAVTARLDWPTNANANLDLRWSRCADPQDPVGNANGATSNNPEQTSVSVPAGTCWFLAVLMPSGGSEVVFARLTITTP